MLTNSDTWCPSCGNKDYDGIFCQKCGWKHKEKKQTCTCGSSELEFECPNCLTKLCEQCLDEGTCNTCGFNFNLENIKDKEDEYGI